MLNSEEEQVGEEVNLRIDGFLDENWEEVLAMNECSVLTLIIY